MASIPSQTAFRCWIGKLATLEEDRCAGIGIQQAEGINRKVNAMTKTLDALAEVIRNPKPSFRQVDDRPQKAKKHRYERRKIREFLRIGDWAQEEPA